MAAVSCSSALAGALPVPSSTSRALHSSSCASSSAHPSAYCRAPETHGVQCRASRGDLSGSAPGAASRHDAASSSSCYGSGGAPFRIGDCRNRSSKMLCDDGVWSRKFGRGLGNRRGRRGGGVRARAGEEAGIVKEIADLSESLLKLKGVVTSEYRAIGPEMRGRVERLYDRTVVLQQSADRAISSGTRIPTQLTANLIALQREHGSLENIVRLAMEASPALESLEAAVSRSSAPLSDAASNLLLEEAKPKASIFQSLIRQSAVEPVKKPPPEYAMSAPASQGSSPLAAFRAEIERRVIEQLAGKKTSKPSVPPTPAEPASALPASQSRPSEEALAEEQTLEEAPEVLEESNGQLSALSAEEAVGTVTMLEDKLKQLELELAKSLPLQVFEQKVAKINVALSDARAEVGQLTADVAEKEAILAEVKKDMLSEQEQLMQKVRDLTGDLEKMYSVEDIELAVNSGLEDLERELGEEQDRTFLLSVELEKKEKFISEQQESWLLEKEEMEAKILEEQNRALSLNLELETRAKLMAEQEATWKEAKLALEADFNAIKTKLQDVRRKRTKERAQLAEKKQKVKALEQQLARLKETMDEGDRTRLKSREATHATVRGIITKMVQSSRAKADSEMHASSLEQKVAKLQEENQVLEDSARAAEAKAGQAEIEIEGIKASLAKVGREVANLQGELPLGERAAALEKFFGIMAKLIKEEAENMEEGNELLADEDLHMTPEESLAASAADDWDDDLDDLDDLEDDQADLEAETSGK